MDDYMISTSDNPFNPYTHFDEWNAFDQELGYNTLSFLARIVVSSHDLSELEQEIAYHQAVDEIVRENITGTYIKVPAPKAGI